MNKRIGIFLCLFIMIAGIATTTYPRRWHRHGCYRGYPCRYRRGYYDDGWGAAVAIPAIVGGVAATAAAASEARERERAYRYYDEDYDDDDFEEEEWED